MRAGHGTELLRGAANDNDHAVIDRALGAPHVFTGQAISGVPPSRARLLPAVAG